MHCIIAAAFTNFLCTCQVDSLEYDTALFPLQLSSLSLSLLLFDTRCAEKSNTKKTYLENKLDDKKPRHFWNKKFDHGKWFTCNELQVFFYESIQSSNWCYLILKIETFFIKLKTRYIFFPYTVLPIQISQFTKFPTSTLKGPIANGGQCVVYCSKTETTSSRAPSWPEKLGGRSTGVDLLSKLELESERNEKPATYYSSLAYTVCMKSALHVCTVKDRIRPHVFGRVLNCRQLVLYSTRSPLEPNG